jgi:carbonic anhydrase/acetyltransferase-like protein (isoleucine patch superfamily)
MNFNRLSTDDKILIMEGAQVLGDVVAGEGTAFWYNSVCRGEMQSVRIGKRCNIQDLALIHNKVTIGDDVSVGHCATVHGATIGDRVTIYANATIVGGDIVIGSDSTIGGNVWLMHSVPPRSTVLMPDLRPQVRGKESRAPGNWSDWVI